MGAVKGSWHRPNQFRGMFGVNNIAPRACTFVPGNFLRLLRVFPQLAMPKGRQTRIGPKEIIRNVHDYFEREQEKSPSRRGSSSIKKTAQATGRRRRTVELIVGQKTRSDKRTLSTSKISKKSRKYVEIGDLDTEAVRRVLYEFYERKERPTLHKLRKSLKDREIYLGSRLRSLLRKIGFRYRKERDTIHVHEDPEVIYQRHEYVRRMGRNRAEGRPVVYVGDARALFAHKGTGAEAEGITSRAEGEMCGAPSKEDRIVVLHAGSKDGWIEGAESIFESETANEHYHEQIDADMYEDWFCNKLLPNIPARSLIVTVNKSYCSRISEAVPTVESTTTEMQDWLMAHDIDFPEGALKSELFCIIRLSKYKPKLVIDEMAKSSGHEVVRLPPYHRELNPTELVLAQVTSCFKSNKKKFQLSAVKCLTHEGCAKVDPKEWKKFVDHVMKAEDRYLTTDCLQEDYLEEIGVCVELDSDSPSIEQVTSTSMSSSSSDTD